MIKIERAYQNIFKDKKYIYLISHLINEDKISNNDFLES